MKLRSSWLTFAIVFFLLLSGCGQVPRGEKLSFDKPDARPDTTIRPDTAIRPETTIRSETTIKPDTIIEKDGIIKENVRLGDKNVGGRHVSELSTLLSEQAAKTAVRPVDASFNSKTWQITPGKKGKRINTAKTADALVNAKKGARIKYIYDELSPAVSTDKLKKNIREIGKYTTTLLDRGPSRVNNIRLASRRINYMILKPGQEFSFNKTVGRRTAAKGYEEAPIIVRTPEGPKKKDAKGGGICQVSTTIYNAAESCGLKITERHLHSKDVGYVPRGNDATVSIGGVDFRFVNNRSHPIMLRIKVNRKSITVRIFENSSI